MNPMRDSLVHLSLDEVLELLRSLPRDVYGFRVTEALRHHGAPAIPGIIEVLRNGPDASRSVAAQALAWMGPRTIEARAAGPALLELLEHSDSQVRGSAAYALSHGATPALKPHAAHIAACLKRERESYPLGYLLRLVPKVGPAARVARPSLWRVVHESNASISALGRSLHPWSWHGWYWQLAMLALCAIEPPGDEVAAHVLRHLRASPFGHSRPLSPLRWQAAHVAGRARLRRPEIMAALRPIAEERGAVGHAARQALLKLERGPHSA